MRDDGSNARVLLVDDAPANLIALSAVLGTLGAELVEARSGPEAIELVEKNWFAVVLLDVQMPGMDGFETAARIRACDRGREVPIIFLTAIHRDERFAVKGYEAGAADYITKPYDAQIVRARVKAFVDLFRQRERQRRERLESALTFAPAFISVFRVPDYVCEFANARHRELFAGRDIVGSAASALGVTPEAIALFDQVAASGESLALTEMPVTLVHRGSPPERLFDSTIQPLRDGQGRIDAILVFAIEVTTQVRAREELERARVAAEQANRAKDDFLATVSHELRTPLSSILGWAAATRRKDLAPEIERALEVIERNARTQARLIDDILDVSRIIGDNLRLEVAPIDLAEAIDGAVESLRPVALAKGVSVVTSVGLVGFVEADALRLQQVIWNVVSNAIKFTGPGGHVAISADRLDGRAVIRVTDDGQGIAPSLLPHLFERFWQADASTTRRHGGLGLGLAIVSHIVRAHGGTVTASSQGEGSGTSIAIALPAPTVPALLSTPGPVPSPPTTAQPGQVRLDDLRILVVDDDDDARALLEEVFAEAGAFVACASSADEALEQLAGRRPDIIISDIGMPQVNGYSLMQAIRRLPHDGGSATPAIALTAYSRPEDAERAIAAGYQLHAAKPIDPLTLLSSVAALTGRAALP
jgi:signal transduction histidine kinase